MQNSASGQLNPDPKEDAPWYVKYGVKGLATVGGGRKLENLTFLANSVEESFI